MWNIVEIVLKLLVAAVLVYLAVSGMRKLMKGSEARESAGRTGEAYIKRGYDPDEQEKRRIEENR